MGKDNMVYHNEILLSYEEEENIAICNNMGEI